MAGSVGVAASAIEGRWVRLVPVAAYAPAALEGLSLRLGMRPEMVAPGAEGLPRGSRFGEAAIIAAIDSGEPLGVIGNVEIGDFPGVAGLVIFVDEKRTRAGYAMEAFYRYVARVFALGATKVQMEVLSFNTPVHRIMNRIGARPEAVLREHFFIAGRHWDATLYGLDREAWQSIERRYGRVVQRPVALAGNRTSPETVSQKETAPMKVDYLVLSDAAIATDGKHYLHGAGWDTIAAPSFPVFHRHMSAAVRLRYPGGGPQRRLGVDVVDATGASLLSAPIYNDVTPSAPATPDASTEQSAALVFNFDGLHFVGPGTYAVVISVDGTEVHRSNFNVRQSV